MKIDIHKEVEIESTIRTELLSSMFEVPTKTKLSVTLTGESEHDRRDYNIGLIVGPSGSGKTLLLENVFGEPNRMDWGSKSVIDDFPSVCSMEDISRVCQAVGFNTIPSWLRPFSVLSNGERFRVEMARRLLDVYGTIYVDEFTSVVDRQVACFACHAIQKYVRSYGKKLVVASCHYDIIDWLQPDWILEPGNPCRFTWRSLQPRPPINVSVSRVKYETWNLFRDFHYMSADLNKAARCYGLFVASEGLDVQYNDEHFRSCTDGSGDNSGANRGSRLSRSSILSQCSVDSSVVFRQDNECENKKSECLQSTDSSYAEETDIQRSVGRSPVGFERSGEAGISGIRNGPASNEGLATSTTGNDRPTKEGAPLQSQSQAWSDLDDGGRRRSLLHVEREKTPTYRIASMCGVLHRPHPKVSDICGFTRMVTLPDFQGLGLAFVLACKVASAYKALGKRLHSYPNHPAWIRSYQRSSLWMQVKDSGTYSPRRGATSSVGGFGNKRCAVFMFTGDSMNVEEAKRLIYGD